MSSTHDPRGQNGYRAESKDFFETPPWAVDRLLDAVELPTGLYLEPGAGRGSIIRAVNARMTGARWTAIEQNPAFEPDLLASGVRPLQVVIDDFLNVEPPPWKFDVTIGNPPYRDAMRFLQHAFTMSKMVIFLLRNGFLATEERNPFMRANPPDVFFLPNRPPYRGNGTDSTDYGWFVWYPGVQRQQGTLEILGLTPLKERRPLRDTLGAQTGGQ